MEYSSAETTEVQSSNEDDEPYDAGRSIILIIALIVIFVVIFGGLAIAMRYGTHTVSSSSGTTGATAPIPPPNNNSEPGKSSDGTFFFPNNCAIYKDQISCEASPGRFWNTTNSNVGVCTCLVPFWGANGFRETYSDKYIAIGNPEPDDITTTIISTNIVDRLSFPFSGKSPSSQIECTILCDGMTDCTGVIWTPPPPPDLGISERIGICTLLQGDVFVNQGQNIPFSTLVDSTLYMKGDRRPKFTDRVFIYVDELPLRYWLQFRVTTPGMEMLTAEEEFVYSLQFFPLQVINDGLLTGVYSTVPMNIADVRTIIANGGDSEHYVHFPNQPLLLPKEWEILPLQVAYVVYP